MHDYSQNVILIIKIGDACPVVTFEIDQNTKLPQDRVVQSIDEIKCRNCSDSNSLKKRWQQGKPRAQYNLCIYMYTYHTVS